MTADVAENLAWNREVSSTTVFVGKDEDEIEVLRRQVWSPEHSQNAELELATRLPPDRLARQILSLTYEVRDGECTLRLTESTVWPPPAGDAERVALSDLQVEVPSLSGRHRAQAERIGGDRATHGYPFLTELLLVRLVSPRPRCICARTVVWGVSGFMAAFWRSHQLLYRDRGIHSVASSTTDQLAILLGN